MHQIESKVVKRQSCIGRVSQKIRDQDKFGESYQMKLSGDGDGQTSVTSWMGSLCTLLMVLMLGGYTYQKVDVFIKKEGAVILQTLHDSYYGNDDNFGYEQGFNVAVALDTQLDPSIGQIVFVRYSWGYDSDGKYFVDERILESHRCTQAELGLDLERSNEATFMPVHYTSKSTLQ